MQAEVYAPNPCLLARVTVHVDCRVLSTHRIRCAYLNIKAHHESHMPIEFTEQLNRAEQQSTPSITSVKRVHRAVEQSSRAHPASHLSIQFAEFTEELNRAAKHTLNHICQ